MPAYDEELFGPVASVIRVIDEAEALRVCAPAPQLVPQPPQPALLAPCSAPPHAAPFHILRISFHPPPTSRTLRGAYTRPARPIASPTVPPLATRRSANDTPFGLGAAVFTQDLARGARIAEYELDAGMCAVNDFCKSNSRYPFGGHKDSGIGRECGEHGFKEFCNVKTVMCPTP